MKRISLVLAAAVLTAALAGCGSDDESTDANGLRKGTPGASATTTAAPTTTSKAPATTKADATTTTSAAPATPSATITCREFKTLDEAGQKLAIEAILAANPGGAFDGSPNMALSTAKLICLVPGNADKPVASAAGMRP
ncbi:hypothetical protein [Nocardia camponoti]|nr:hypothetical protein [Nocardia camponoti]